MLPIARGSRAETVSRRFPQAEQILKRSIPVLIIAFLLVVAASHVFGIMVEHARMEAAARQRDSLSHRRRFRRLFQMMRSLFRPATAMAPKRKLATYLPQDRLDTGAFVLARVRRRPGLRSLGRWLRLYRPDASADFLPEVSTHPEVSATMPA